MPSSNTPAVTAAAEWHAAAPWLPAIIDPLQLYPGLQVLLADSAGVQHLVASRTTTTGHLLSHQHQVLPSSEPITGSVSTAWQQQQLTDDGATHPAAASRKLLQATTAALGSAPGISSNSGNSSISSNNSTSSDSNSTSSPSAATAAPTADPSSREDTVVLSVTVPSNVKTVQVLLTNGVPGSNATSLSIDSSSDSNVTLSSAPAAAASIDTAGSKPAAAADTWTWGEFFFWFFIILIALGLGVGAGADMEKQAAALRASRTPAVGVPAASNNSVAFELGRVQGSREPTAGQCGTSSR